MKRRYLTLTLALGLALALVALGLGWVGLSFGGSPDGAEAGTTKTVYMSAIEYKGSANTATEAFPVATPEPGGGYKLTAPDAGGNWSTSSYRWDPGVIVVNRGDQVDLRIWGVNGSVHHAHIERYVDSFQVRRGSLTVVSFTADKLGTFRIHCETHEPSMEALLVVVPGPSK